MNANPYLASLSILVAALGGVTFGGGRVLYEWFQWDIATNNVAMVAAIVMIWGYNLAESIIASDSWKQALGRSLLILLMLVLAAVVGAVASVIVLCIIAIIALIVIIWFVIQVISIALGNGVSKGKVTLTDEYGNKIKGERHGDTITTSDGRKFDKSLSDSNSWEER